MYKDIWVAGASNQLFIRGSYSEEKFSKKKKKVVTGKTPLLSTGPFCTTYSIYLNIGFWQGSFV